MPRPLRISPRYLGQMKLKGFCPRCFWYAVQMDFKLPFDRPMPGILFNLDIFEKNLVEAHYAAEGKLPKWLAQLKAVRPVEFPRKMLQEFPDLNITMVGMPDAVFSTSTGSLVLVDYKTARYKGPDDPFMPAYETQLLGYSSLLKANGIGTVEKAALVYFHNLAKENNEDPMKLFTEEGMTIPFEVKIHEVEIDMTTLDPLLNQIREVADLPHPPEGLIKCKDCGRLTQLLESEERLRNMQDSKQHRDQLYRQVFYPKLEAHRRKAKLAGLGFDSYDDLLTMQDDGDFVPAVWDL